MGTPQYISPEQAMGKKELDAGTDIYSFAVMLYEMVVGQVPFNADTPFSIIHDHIYSPLPLPRSINPLVPEPVERVLLKSLAKERADRHASVAELCVAFKDAWTQAGVPMQGTSITVRPATFKTASQPPAQKTAVSAAPAPIVSEQPSAQKKKRPVWLYVIGVIILLAFCVSAGAVARRQGLFRKLLGINDIATQENVNALTPLPFSTQQPLNGVKPPSPEIQAGMDAVRNNPNDPQAHLQLSLAFYDAGQEREAFQELLRATELAKEDKNFYKGAADQFRDREAWIAVSAMELRLANLYIGDGQKVPDDVQVNFREASYRAAEQSQMTDYVFFDRISSVDQPFGLIVQGRYALFNGSPSEAQIYLNDANKLKPDIPEALLLQAEIYLKQGNNDSAKQILTVLKANLAAPNWIRHMADDYYRTLP
jgi:tetratricopeptide (TPR) repeat protein